MSTPCSYQTDLLLRLAPQLARARKASYGWHSEAEKARDRARYVATHAQDPIVAERE